MNTCLAVVRAALQGSEQAATPALAGCRCSLPTCTRAPNAMTSLHALAMRPDTAFHTAAAAAATLPPALLEAQLDRHNKYAMHLLLDAAGIELTEAKKLSRFYARFSGATALEVAICLGHAAAAAALLAAGARVRPQALDSLLLYCPPLARDAMSALLAASQVGWRAGAAWAGACPLN